MTERSPLVYAGPRLALLRRVASLSVDDLHALDRAVRDLVVDKTHRQVDKGYFFAWWVGPRLDGADEAELGDLFGYVLGALATGLTGLDVERFGAHLAPKQGIFDGLLKALSHPSEGRRIQDVSIGLITDALAPWDPRLAIVATWNMACAGVLRDRLPPEVTATLEAAWRRALGEPPI